MSAGSMSDEEINGRTGSDKLFPGKLHDMLDYAQREDMEDVVSWTGDGQAFLINKPKELIEILPMFFGHSKYRSFHRQLNMWSYRRLVDGPNKGAFTHPYFLKGQKARCKTISRHQFRSMPLEKTLPSPLDDTRAQSPTTSHFKEAWTSFKRSSSQVSVDSETEMESSYLTFSCNHSFLKDGDAVAFEGMPFRFVGFDLNLFGSGKRSPQRPQF